jgi:hypothetical protein
MSEMAIRIYDARDGRGIHALPDSTQCIPLCRLESALGSPTEKVAIASKREQEHTMGRT